MVDIHCHILPFWDDGAADYEEALRMLAKAYQSGVRGVIATPHCNIPYSFTNYWSDELDRALAALQHKADEHGIDVRVFAGQEVFLYGDIEQLFRQGKLITLNRSRYMLTELPFRIRPADAYRLVAQTAALGVVPVLAHPERYHFFDRYEDAADRMIAMGALLQVNKDSLFGEFGAVPERVAHRLIAKRQAHFVASDGHSPYARCPVLDGAHEMISELYSMEYADYLITENPGKVLANREVDQF